VLLPALLDVLLVQILRAWLASRNGDAPRWAVALHDPAVGSALRAIHTQPDRSWTVGELGTRVGLSRAVFARRFTALVGQPPLAYLSWWRMTVAARLLREGDASTGGDRPAGRVRLAVRLRARVQACPRITARGVSARNGISRSSSASPARSAITAPLPSVIEPQAQVRVDAVVDRWDLPEPDRVLLRRFGLPHGPLLRPMPQADAEPTLIPNIAGEPERRIATADQRLYLLGVYGANSVDSVAIRVGAVAGTGQVMGLRGRPMHIPSLTTPPPTKIKNGTVARSSGPARLSLTA